MIKLRDFIRAMIKASDGLPVESIGFDVGIGANMEVRQKSPNRVKFFITKTNLFDAFDIQSDNGVLFICKKCGYNVKGGLQATTCFRDAVKEHYEECRRGQGRSPK
jgi:hypothetical protein